MAKGYKYLMLESQVHFGRLYVATTDEQTVKALIDAITQLGGSPPEVKNDRPSCYYELKRLRPSELVVYRWAISWLCSNGWKPYAAHGSDARYPLHEKHHFRKVMEDQGKE